MRHPPGGSDQALEVVARLARVRERTCAELQTRLEAKGFGAAEAAVAVQRATELGYVDDGRAAQALVERWRARGASRAFLADKLAGAGVATTMSEAVLTTVPPDRALAIAALSQRYPGATPPRGRAARFLASKGYEDALIEDLLGELIAD